MGSRLLGWRTVCAVELDAYCRQVLLARQRDGQLDRFPIWDDVRTFDGQPWRGAVDVVSGGFPCQDISCAGKGAGIEGERSGMWVEMARIIGEVRPRFALVENSPMLTSRGLGRVLGDLAAMGFNARWGVLGARHAGAPHRRDRIWIAARASGIRCEPGRARQSLPRVRLDGAPQLELLADSPGSGMQANAPQNGQARRVQRESGGTCWNSREIDWWSAEPDMGRVANGVAHRVDRLGAIGNGQVPAVAALAWDTLKDGP